MTAKEVSIIQKLDELRRASHLEGQCQQAWANGRGYTSEVQNYTNSKAATNNIYQELIKLLVTE